MKKAISYGIAVVLAVMMAACSDSDNGEENLNPELPQPDPVVTLLTAEEQAALPDVNAAQLDFFEKVYKHSSPGENVVCSPLSAQVLLSMLANDAEPESAAEIYSALGCGNQELLNSMNVKLMDAMKKASPVTFKSANALWYDTQYTLSDAGKDLISGSYAPRYSPAIFRPVAPPTKSTNGAPNAPRISFRRFLMRIREFSHCSMPFISTGRGLMNSM